MKAKKNMKKDLERKGKRNYLCLPVSREILRQENHFYIWFLSFEK